MGLPNVGKSSLINSLKRARVAQVGNAPGVTRSVQQISLDKHINLLDSPGMVFSSSEAGDAWSALRNCVKVRVILLHCKNYRPILDRVSMRSEMDHRCIFEKRGSTSESYLCGADEFWSCL